MSKITYKKNKRREREEWSVQAEALRIILLELHGLAAAQPLTPVRDTPTPSYVQVGRRRGHGCSYRTCR